MASTNDFPMPKAPVLEKETATDKYGKFVAFPFQSGFGHTIGNALRRVLLSSLEGSAISAVRIDGTTHEFSSLPNVVEDVTEIILNLKKVKLKLLDDQHKVLEIKKNEAGPVTAGDIINDGTVDIVNPDQVICTLDKDVPFRAEIEISKGRGWSPAEKNKRAEQPLGTILVDCLYSPVTYVRYQVGAARVGEETEKDSLTLEIYTDGRITPQDALKKATEILADHLNPFLGNEKPASPGLSPAEQKLLKTLTQDVDVLELSVRAMNCLNTANIKLLGELCLRSEARMLKFRNFGKKSLDEIKEKLVPLNLHLAMPLSENLANAIQAEAERAKASKKEEI